MSAAEKTVARAKALAPKQIHVSLGRCKGCQLCIEICPMKSSEVLMMSKELSRRGYLYPIVNNLPACTGCRLCEMVCPDFAIHLEFDESAKKATS